MQRAFPLALVILAVTSAAHAQTPATPEARARAVHVLNRLTFGPRNGDVDRVLAMGIDRWIEQQLNVDASEEALLPLLWSCDMWTTPPDSLKRFRNYIEIPPPDGSMTRGRLFVEGGFNLMREASPSPVFDADRSIMGCRMMRLEMSERQLLEVMTEFWLNHFYVSSISFPSRSAFVQYDRTVIRPNALGRFRDLLGAVAHTPAMLAYLNNDVSGPLDTEPSLSEFDRGIKPGIVPRTGLNENYARELLELHTMGVDGGYTQADVIAVARAFSGWSHTGRAYACVESPLASGTMSCRQRAQTSPTFMFDSTKHDAGSKTVLGRTLPAGQGLEDGEMVLDILARHPSTARFIARKLATRFISDAPPAAVIDRAAQTFLRSDGDMRAVLRTIFESEEFARSQGAKIRSPLEFVLSVRRALGASFDGSGESVDAMIDMGQPPFGRRSPDGWPDNAAAWLSTGSVLARINYAHAIAIDSIASIRLRDWPPWQQLLAESYEKQVDGVLELLLHGNASPELRAALLAAQPSHADPNSAAAREQSLRKVVALVLGSPDFQRR